MNAAVPDKTGSGLITILWKTDTSIAKEFTNNLSLDEFISILLDSKSIKYFSPIFG